eukprot:TRINITY_DN18726_c0_g1_i1.p1 TRINITY_DN18726_c0_g1~~TRINITY_DN18726_c0_g1_i1.p1  ORF type:complete len:568 (+),score=97.39 TRINITY_DN18726_c0_g1_i1:37-1704(+)
MAEVVQLLFQRGTPSSQMRPQVEALRARVPGARVRCSVHTGGGVPEASFPVVSCAGERLGCLADVLSRPESLARLVAMCGPQERSTAIVVPALPPAIPAQETTAIAAPALAKATAQAATSPARALQRAAEACTQRWLWLQETAWKPYDAKCCRVLDGALLQRPAQNPREIQYLQYSLDIVYMVQTNQRTNNKRNIMYEGARPYRVNYRGRCGYGLPTYEQTERLYATSSMPPQDGSCPLLELSNEMLLCILQQMCDRCSCQCHTRQLYTNDGVRALCTLSLVCKRFSAPCGDYSSRSLTEEAAHRMCTALGVHDRVYVPTDTWCERLLLLDPKVVASIQARKEELHQIAYGRLESNYRSWWGEHTHCAKDRQFAKYHIERLWGHFDSALRNKARAAGAPMCFSGEGSVDMEGGFLKLVKDVSVGDRVLTGNGCIRTVTRITRDAVFAERPVCVVAGLTLTTGHPLWRADSREWAHPFEQYPVEQRRVDFFFNFELDCGPDAGMANSVVINGLVLATLGCDCGERICTNWPKQDALYGRGYWARPESAWRECARRS